MSAVATICATVVSDWTACSGPRSYDLTAEPDGDYTFEVLARDAVGNASATASSDYTLDSSIPGTPTIDSAPDSPSSDATPSSSSASTVSSSRSSSTTGPRAASTS